MKPEWGLKRACRKCSAHFYDLGKPQFKCPKCEASFTLEDYAPKPSKISDYQSKKDLRKKLPAEVIVDPAEINIDDIETDLEEALIVDVDELEDELDDSDLTQDVIVPEHEQE